jgi:hypothetical protein
MLVVACVIKLLEGLGRSKFKKTLEEDEQALKKGGLTSRQYVAAMYRLGQKTVLCRNLKLLNVLMRILARYRGGSLAEIKAQYMERVEDFESEEEVLPNRLTLRKYLRELVGN